MQMMLRLLDLLDQLDQQRLMERPSRLLGLLDQNHRSDKTQQ
jgi:hypothetical protein